MTHALSWFELPVRDVERAVEFYETVLDRRLETTSDADVPYPTFVVEEGEAGGALVPAGTQPAGDGDDAPTVSYEPGADGPLVYLSVADVDDALDRVEPAGGRVLVGRRRVADGPRYAVVADTEGNRVGLMDG
jgi:hypothetical protein